MAISGTGTGSTLTVNISGAETFSSLATFLNSNPTYGTANPAYLEITANMNFASGATLSRSGNIRNTVIFGTTGFNYRITSTAFNNTNLGIVDFGTDGVLILQANGFQGSSQSQIHARIQATNLDLYVNHASSPVGTADLFYRSDNTILSVYVSGKFRVVYNNTYSSTMGLLLSNSFPLGSLDFVVGASASGPRSLILNGTTNTIVAPISFFKKLGTEETEILWGRNSGSGNWVFNEPTISGTSDVFVKTWNGGIAELRDLQYPSGWNKVVKLDHFSGTWENLNKQLFVKNSITLPELDKIGYAIRVKDNTETQISTKLTADGEFGTKYVTWKLATNPNSGTSVTATTRTNTEVKVRKYDKKEIAINFTEFDRAYSYLLPSENQSYLTLTETQALALTGIAFAPSGATGGVVTISGARTVAELWQSYRAWISQTANFDSGDTWTFDSTTLSVGAWTISGIEFLTVGTVVTSLAAASGAISNLSITGDVIQATPTNLSNVTILGTLTYNTNTDTSIAISSGTEIETVENSGTGIVTISRDNTSSITTYTDAEINFLDSNLSAVGITSATIYGSESDRDANTNAGATFTASIDFKYGSVVNGVTMQDTVYLRVVVGSITLFAQVTLVLGSNDLDLGVQGQLSSINAKVDLTAKEATLLQTEIDIIAEVNENEVKIDALKTKTDTLVNTDISTLSKKADTDLLLKASDYTAPNNNQFTSTDRTKLNSLNNYDDSTLIGKVDTVDTVVDAIKAKTDTLVNTDLTGIATAVNVTDARDSVITEVNANETKIDSLQASVNNLNDFNPTTEQVIVATNNDKTNYELANNAITSSKVANNAFNNSSFTTGYFNSINTEMDTALADYDAPTKAELDAAEADIIAALPAVAPSASTVASAVRTELSTELSRIDVATSTRNDVAPDNAGIASIKAKTDILVNTDLTGIALSSEIAALNDVSVSEVVSGMQAVANDFKADVSGLSTFDPSVDVVARVTLVDTTTTNTDMRGTNGANTIAPDNASIASILADTNELQLNQGAWVTATGFSTPENVTSAKDQIISEVNANEVKIDEIKTKVDTLDNADLSGIESELVDIKKNTNLIPATL